MTTRLLPLAWASLLVVALALLAVAPSEARTTHAPIRVEGDAALAALTAAEGWDGAGTADDPYVIEGLDIRSGSAHRLEIVSTQAHLVIRDVRAEGGGASYDGIRLVGVRNVVVEDSILERNRVGIHLENVQDVELRGNTVRTSTTGIGLVASSDVLVEENRVQLNAQDVRLERSSGNAFARNNLSISPGQTGFAFVDNASYSNDLDETNVVNAIPLRWYSGVSGTEAEPLVLGPFTTSLPGITNVAQVMLHDASHVRLEDVVATGGSAAGIVVHGGSDVSIVEARAEDNAGAGLRAEQVDGLVVEGSDLRENGGDGAYLKSILGAELDGTDARDNVGAGVRIEDAPDARVADGNLSSNDAGGLLVARSARPTVESNLVHDNGVVGLHLSSSADAVVGANRLWATPQHVKLTLSPGGTFRDNVLGVVAGEIGFHFDDETSYAVDADTSNVVSGAALRWYSGVEGPLTIASPRVEVAGITNVAQIMVHDSVDVTLTGAIATNGAASGIVVHDSHGVRLVGPRAEDNAEDGIQLDGGNSTIVESATVADNGGSGVHVAQDGARLTSVAATSNALDGIAVVGASDVVVSSSALTSNAGRGLYASGSSDVVLNASSVRANAGGGAILEGSSGAVRANAFVDNKLASVALSSAASGVVVQNNTITALGAGISLSKTEGAEIAGNRIVLRAAAYGISFADETSYANDVATSNTVNGTTVRWYHALAGTSASPERLVGPEVDEPRITNVAQIACHRCENVTIESPEATDGVAIGILVLRSGNVNVTGAEVEDIDGAGIQIDHGHDNVVFNARVSGAGGAGLSISGDDNAAHTVTVEDGGGPGVHLKQGGARSRVEHATLVGNEGGILVDRSTDAQILASALESNGAYGVFVSDASGASVSSSTMEGHVSAVRLAAATLAEFHANAVTVSDGEDGFHFDDDDSYATTIPATNTVNGVPMRWYVGATGNVTGVRAGAPNMTNVAQVMVYQSPGLALHDAYAANGSAAGFMVLESEGATLSSVNAVENGGEGILVSASEDVELVAPRASGNVGVGIVIEAASHDTTVRGGDVEENAGGGILASLSDRLDVRETVVQENGATGILLDRVTGSEFSSIQIKEHASNVRLRLSSANEFAGTDVRLRDGDTGFVFDDETSYDNAIDSSNVVDRAPVRWHTNLAGTAQSPIVLSGEAVRARNVTNVAQIMVYKSSYVVLDEPVALDGPKHGILVHRSSSVEVSNATASGNVNGIALEHVLSAAVVDNDVGENDVGILLVGTSNSRLTRNDATGSAVAVKLSDATSRNNRIDETLATGATGGTVVDPSIRIAAPPTGANLVVDAGADKRVRFGDDVNLTDAVAVSPSTTDRIEMQEWEFGDGESLDSRAARLFRPSHRYDDTGTFEATYRVRTTSGATYSDSVLIVVAPPSAAPTNLTARSTAAGVEVAWTAPTDHGNDSILKTVVWRASGAAGPLVRLGEVAPGVATFLDANVVGGATYRYTVAAVTARGEGDQATPVTHRATTLPAAPASVAALLTDGHVNVTWSAPAASGGLPVLRYLVYAGGESGAMTLLAEVNATAPREARVVAGAPTHVAVSAANALGEGALSARAPVVDALTPRAPVLQALLFDDGARLSWRADEGATSHRVYRALGDGALALLREVVGANETLDVEAVANGTYRYAVSSVNSFGEGARSSIATLRVTGERDDAGPEWNGFAPEPETEVAAAATVFSAAVSDASGVRLDSVRVDLDGENMTERAIVGASGIELRVDALAPGEHRVRLSALDARGNAGSAEWSFRAVEPEPPEDANASLRLVGLRVLAREPVTPGERLNASVIAVNDGHAPLTARVALLVDGVEVAAEEVEIPPLDLVVVRLAFAAPDVGVHELEVPGAGWSQRLVVVAAADPREGGGDEARETPAPGSALLLAALAWCALARRRRR